MSHAWLYSLMSVIAVSLMALVALAIIAFDERMLQRFVPAMMGLAVGAMLGDAFLHLLPELYDGPRSDTRVALGILAGLVLFYLLELTVRRHHDRFHRHHHHAADTHQAPGLPTADHLIAPVGYVSLFAGSLHNIMDGVLLAASYLTSFKVGLATTIAIILHELPHEIGGFGVLVHAGFTRSRALLFNLLTGIGALLGALVCLSLGSIVEGIPAVMLPLTTGGFIYIAAANLLPELARQTRFSQIAAQVGGILAGVVMMYLLTSIE